MTKQITIRSASEHNLKNIDVDILHNHLTVVTGVSGSGKSSLVFDTICAEGRRLYLESFSAYARQFMGKLGRPSVNHISGLSPAIAVDQKTIVRNPRSTVGTMTELYEYLRLLFARLGKIYDETNENENDKQNQIKLQRSLFSFNSPHGACPQCKGLGVEDHIDPKLLIEDPTKTLRQGALVITTPSGYIIYSQVTMDVLNQVCEANGFNVDIPWQDLTGDQKDIVLNGNDKIKIPYGKHPLESRLKWSGITAKPREEGYYKGILPVMENILRVDRNKNILRFARSMTCGACNGTRLKPEALAVTFRGKTIAQYAQMTIADLEQFFTGIDFSSSEAPVAGPIKEEFLKRTHLLIKLGLGYLTLDRESTSLSGGEAQRIRLASQAVSRLRGILYILDEPSIGLHHRDNQRLLEMLHQLRDNGNTLVVVEHDEDTIRSADRLIDIGPAAGVHGGDILFNGPTADLLKQLDTSVDADEKALMEKSRTRAFLTGNECIPIPALRRKGSGKSITITGATQHNLKNIDVTFPLGVLNVVTGVSGAGKSTLIHHILAAFLKKQLHKANTHPGTYESIDGIQHIDKIIEIDQAPIGRTPRSNPATYTKLFDHIRDLFASLPEAKERKWNKGRFSFNVKGGRCESCEGAGLQQIGMHFMGNVDIVCDTCGGKRFNNETLEIRYKGKNIYDILEMPIEEAGEFFKDHSKISIILDAMLQLGLGYISLGQSSTILSGGEAQRIKLAAELCKPATGKTLYILDEPTTGLHAADIKILLQSLNRLVDKGNTVITVEHHPDFIKTADQIIDLGPESGHEGGQLVATGTPEEVAENERSHTGAFLLDILTQTELPPLPFNREPGIQPDDPIHLYGVSTNNLKRIDVEIPVNRLTVITGVSGSGKSSLAFDTVFAEGRRQFLSGFSTYARRFMAGKSKTEMENYTGLMPAIAVSQKTASHNPRSTVGTMTEIYDYYRLLFARAGKPYSPSGNDNPASGGQGAFLENRPLDPRKTFVKGKDSGIEPLLSTMFSFNHQQGACSHCKGLGVVTVGDPRKLVTHPDKSLMAGALDGSKTGKFYGDPYGQYTAILQTVGEMQGIDFSQPWQELDEVARTIAMYGTGDTRYDVIWKFKRKNREGEHRFETEWLGFVNYVNEEYERKHADARGQAMLPLMSDETCPSCDGRRLKPEYLAITFAGINISQLCCKTVLETCEFFAGLEKSGFVSERELAITVELRREILRRLRFLEDVGLDYLSLDRNAVTLSGGEAQRIRLAGQLGSGLTGVIYVLDEPTIGLHSRDTARLLAVLKNLRDLGNTVIVVEHDAEVMRAADHIIDMGPGAGRDGGCIVAQGQPEIISNNENSKTGQYLKTPAAIPVPVRRRQLSEGIFIGGAHANNLKNIGVHLPFNGIVVLTGVSGSGKSTLLFDVLVESVQRGMLVGCNALHLPGQRPNKSFSGIQGAVYQKSPLAAGGTLNLPQVIAIDQKGIGATPSSTPATYTGLFDKIRDLFTKTEASQSRGYKKNRFSFNVKGGRCEECKGMGQVSTSMDFLSDVWTECEECKGKRYNGETLEITYNGKTISDVLDMTVSEAREFFVDQAVVNRILVRMESVGLGYLQLGQAGNTLSGGESQRLKLVAELLKESSKSKGLPNIYIFDEPTTGLHFEDIKVLLRLFNELVEAGHTVYIIEHNPDVIKSADYIIDLGPEGGERGGTLTATGTPEEVATVETSQTGKLLSALL